VASPGTPVETIRHALLRDGRGVASSPLGMALDLIVGEPQHDHNVKTNGANK
jgi:hypothetical protein